MPTVPTIEYRKARITRAKRTYVVLLLMRRELLLLLLIIILLGKLNLEKGA